MDLLKMKILIIIPVYNEEKNLVETLNSFVNQTHPISQLTLVDDGSTDNTSNIIKKFSRNINQ